MTLTKVKPDTEEIVPFQDRYPADRAWLEEKGFEVGRNDGIVMEYKMQTNHGPIEIRFYNEEYYDHGITAKLTLESNEYFHLDNDIEALRAKYDSKLQTIVSALKPDIETLDHEMKAETDKLNTKLNGAISGINFDKFTPIKFKISTNGYFNLTGDYAIENNGNYWEINVADKNKSAEELYKIIDDAVENLELAQSQESNIEA